MQHAGAERIYRRPFWANRRMRSQVRQRFIGTHGLGEVVSLPIIAIHRLQHGHLVAGFNPLRDRGESQILG